jgi:hypothetical protein
LNQIASIKQVAAINANEFVKISLNSIFPSSTHFISIILSFSAHKFVSLDLTTLIFSITQFRILVSIIRESFYPAEQFDSQTTNLTYSMRKIHSINSHFDLD